MSIHAHYALPMLHIALPVEVVVSPHWSDSMCCLDFHAVPMQDPGKEGLQTLVISDPLVDSTTVNQLTVKCKIVF